jgi:hypothetical protein
LVAIVADVLSWTFVIGMIGTVFLVILISAYQLFSVLFEKDSPDETDPQRPPSVFEVTLALCEDSHTGRGPLRLPLAFSCLNYAIPVKAPAWHK